MSIEEKTTIRNFTGLSVWKYSHELYVEIYAETKKFPQKELFGLTNQIRRASLSVTSNIAEGFGRRSNLERIQFYSISKGSLFEVQNQLYAARDIGLLDSTICANLIEKSVTAQKLLIGLIGSTAKKSVKIKPLNPQFSILNSQTGAVA